MHLLAATPDITPITSLITTWIHIGRPRRVDRRVGFHRSFGVDVINTAGPLLTVSIGAVANPSNELVLQLPSH
jgi:hypothetical protein